MVSTKKRTPAGYIAFTAPINSADSSDAPLTREQVWRGLQRKVRHAEEFVGNAITHTTVLGESQDEHGRDVITREVTFREGNRKVKEICTFFEPMKVEFKQPDGSNVMNIVSDTADGGMAMTYQFEWLAPDADEAELKEKLGEWKKMAQGAVESSLKVIRDMVKDGRL